MYQIRQGSIKDAIAIEEKIPEFDLHRTEQDYLERLAGRRHLILIASWQGQDVGYKVGYAKSGEEFYSWLGGVVPGHRGWEVATRLRQYQESWVTEQGYKSITVKSTNRFPAMLQMLINSGYQISGYEPVGEVSDSKIYFNKYLQL